MKKECVVFYYGDERTDNSDIKRSIKDYKTNIFCMNDASLVKSFVKISPNRVIVADFASFSESRQVELLEMCRTCRLCLLNAPDDFVSQYALSVSSIQEAFSIHGLK